MHGLYIAQELHGLDGLQLRVQFINSVNASRQVQLHDRLFRETLQMLDDALKATAMGCNQYPFPLLDLGSYFLIPERQSSGNSVLQALAGRQLIFSEVCISAILNSNRKSKLTN